MSNKSKSILFGIFFLVASLNTYSQCSLTTTATFDTIVCGGSVTLSAFGTTIGSPLTTTSFDAGALPAGWACSQAPFWNNPCSPGGVNSTTHFWMGNGTAAPRSLTSSSYNLSGCTNSGVYVCFDMLFMPQGGTAPCEGPDLPNEGVNFQYSTNGGATWTTLNYFAPNGGNDPLLINWNNWCFTLPITAVTANTQFRWYQAFSSDANSDHWGIDNFIVYCNDPSYNIVWQHDGYTTGAAGGVNPTPVSPTITTTYTAVMSNGVTSCSSSVTVVVRNPVVTVNAGSDVIICNGACTQLNATALVVNYPSQNQTYTNYYSPFFTPFSGNPTSYAIPVGGLANPILQPNSIASVCISQIFFTGVQGINFLDVDAIALTLTCPSGQTITLVPANTTNSGLFSTNNGYINTCFVPAGPSIVGQAPPTTGNYAPNQTFNNLTGCTSNGNWTLGIVIPNGVSGGGGGQFYGWDITFNTPQVSYTPAFTWSPTTNMTNSNTLTPTVCPPPNAYTLTVGDTAGCVTVADVVNVNTQSCSGISDIKLTGDTCNASSAITFQVLGTSSSPYFDWNFGDPLSGANNTITITGGSPNPNPSHTFTSPGTYTICVSYQEPGFPVSQICRTVLIGQCCNPNLITNGSFVSPLGFDVIAPGWTGTNPRVNTPDINDASSPCNAGNGFNWIGTPLPSTDGATFQSLFGSEVIIQTVNTGVGQQYTLCFEYAALSITNVTTTYNSGAGIVININGSIVNVTPNDLTPFTWENWCYTFTATTAITTIQLKSTFEYVGIDGVTLTLANALTLSQTHVDATCGNTNGSINLTVTGGTTPYSYLWSNAATTQDISGLAPNTYTVTVTDANGCTRNLSVTINNSNGLTLAESHVNATCGNANGSIDLSITSSSAVFPITYLWSNGATTSDLTNIPANTYTVTVTDGLGCTSTLTVIITTTGTPILSETHLNATCGNANGSIDLTVNGGIATITYLWSNGAVTQDINSLGANNYTVIVTNGNGCTATLSVNITNTAPPTLSETHVNATCGNANGSIDLTVTGGIAPITYLWSNGATTQDINSLATNTYTATVTNGNGCTATLSVAITNTAAPTLSPIYHD